MNSNSNSISEDTLLGFLMNALPDEEQRLVEDRAAVDPLLRQRIEDLRELIGPFQASDEHFEIRDGLAAETIEFVASQAELIEVRTASARLSSPLLDSSQHTRWAWLDSIVALAAGIVLLSMLLPSVWYSRESARRIGCAANLRELGAAIQSFAGMDIEGRLPRIDADGPLSFAGVYAIRLKESGLLPSSSRLWCPSTCEYETEQTVPSLSVYLSASPVQQRMWRYTIGGNYAYDLGYVVDGTYVTPRMSGRANHVVMGDSYPNNFDNSKRTFSSPAHLQNACNILYGDGRIQLIRLDFLDRDRSLDHPYLNRDLKQEAGRGDDDDCLGPSPRSPLR